MRAAAATVFVAYTAVMLALERRMQRAGGPGIIPFELAGTATRADEIMARWGDSGQRAARLSLWLDFGYMLTYGLLTAQLVDGARRRQGHSPAIPLIAVPAVAADAVEGITLLKVLGGKHVAVNARRARTAAIVKFVLVFAALVYTVAGYVTSSEEKR